ncbi:MULTISPECIES: hypothetical protein [unclassified Mycobacterium]|uniref:hypothetical protein n=1 Tax=unclassified Mycobacterium TaxID=2642494 RepID=UPI0007FFD725|nr:MULTISPECIES: hypothetical protein [unclassified Mycobacterium]OBH00375.1 hypothetical protein A5696_16695 [Mycobacterium sp. E2699]OBI51186.1 hypothetical protein A5705_09225 [Mycobacterium sp. E787]
MSATHDRTREAIDIDNDVELITEQIKALRELAKQDDAEAISEGQRYDFSIRWGTVLAGRLRRLVHYSSLGRLDEADERRFRALRDELRTLSHLIDRFRLAAPDFTDRPPPSAKRFRPRR